MLPFLGLQWDMAGSSAATSSSCSTLQRAVNNATLSGLAMGHGRQFGGDLRQLFHSPKSGLAGDAFEAHNPYLRARDHVAVRHSPVSGRLYRRGPRGRSVLERRIECVARPAFIFSSVQIMWNCYLVQFMWKAYFTCGNTLLRYCGLTQPHFR